MTAVLKKYWYYDSVPNEKGLFSNPPDYIIATIGGELSKVIDLHDEIEMPDRKSKRLIKDDSFRNKFCDTMVEYATQNKIDFIGTILWHTKTPEPYKSNPKLFKTRDTTFEREVDGMRARAYAQNVWEIMDKEVVEKQYNTYPIVCVDNENEMIWRSVGVHFYRQDLEGRGEVKIQSRGIAKPVRVNGRIEDIEITDKPAEKKEPLGHKLVGYLASLLWKRFRKELPEHECYTYVQRYDSQLMIDKKEKGCVKFETNYTGKGWKF